MQGKYESEALDDIMTFDSKKIEKCSRYMLRMRNLQTPGEVAIINPECGAPMIIQMLDDLVKYDDEE